MTTFITCWQNTRTPKTITLPSGATETVQYMRDGICLFVSQRSATYKRLSDHSAEFTLIESKAQLDAAVQDYQAVQDKWKSITQ